MRYKAINAQFKADEAKNEITAYASTYDIDLGKDQVVKGAYANTLKSRFDGGKKRDIKVLWQHDEHHPIGLPIHMEEDSTGLLTVSKISQTDVGRNAMQLVRDGVVDKLSIGYGIIDSEMKDGVQLLKELELFEYSLVTFPMNTGASVLGAKNMTAQEKAVIIDYLSETIGLPQNDVVSWLRQKGEGGNQVDTEKLKELFSALSSSVDAISKLLAGETDPAEDDEEITVAIDEEEEPKAFDDIDEDTDIDEDMKALSDIDKYFK